MSRGRTEPVQALALPDAGPATQLFVKVVPGASSAQVAGRHGDRLRVRVAAVAQGGAANRAVESLLAECLGLATRAVRVVSGLTNAHKTVQIVGLAPETVARLLYGDAP